MIQDLVGATPWRFESSRAHHSENEWVMNGEGCKPFAFIVFGAFQVHLIAKCCRFRRQKRGGCAAAPNQLAAVDSGRASLGVTAAKGKAPSNRGAIIAGLKRQRLRAHFITAS